MSLNASKNKTVDGCMASAWVAHTHAHAMATAFTLRLQDQAWGWGCVEVWKV